MKIGGDRGGALRLRLIARRFIHHLLVLAASGFLAIFLLSLRQTEPPGLLDRLGVIMGRVMSLDFGPGFLRNDPRSTFQIALDGILGTILLLGLAMALACLLGLLLRAVRGYRRHRWVDRTGKSAALLFHSMTIIGALMAVYFVYFHLGRLPEHLDRLLPGAPGASLAVVALGVSLLAGYAWEARVLSLRRVGAERLQSIRKWDRDGGLIPSMRESLLGVLAFADRRIVEIVMWTFLVEHAVSWPGVLKIFRFAVWVGFDNLYPLLAWVLVNLVAVVTARLLLDLLMIALTPDADDNPNQGDTETAQT